MYHFPKVLADEVLGELAIREAIYQRPMRIRDDYDCQKVISEIIYRPSPEAIRSLCEAQNPAVYKIGRNLHELLKQRQLQIQRK